MDIRRITLLAVLCALTAAPVRAHHDDDDDDDKGGGEKRQVEVIRGPRNSGGHGGHHGEDGEGPEEGGGGPMGGPGGGMKRMMMPRGRQEGMMGQEMDPEMKAKMEKLRELEKGLRETAMKLRKAKDSEKAALKAEAKKSLGDIFDARLAMEQAMVEKMQEHLTEKKEKLAKKKAAKDKLVEEKLSHITGEAPSWDD